MSTQASSLASFRLSNSNANVGTKRLWAVFGVKLSRCPLRSTTQLPPRYHNIHSIIGMVGVASVVLKWTPLRISNHGDTATLYSPPYPPVCGAAITGILIASTRRVLLNYQRCWSIRKRRTRRNIYDGNVDQLKWNARSFSPNVWMLCVSGWMQGGASIWT